MTKHMKAILDLLDAQYGTEYICYLNHENAWQLLIATILSVQCTDAWVNIVNQARKRAALTGAKDSAVGKKSRARSKTAGGTE